MATRRGRLLAVALGPRPGFVKMTWRLQNEVEQGRPIKEGRVQSCLSGKFISHHILQLFTSLTGFWHPDMKRGSPLTNIIEEGPK